MLPAAVLDCSTLINLEEVAVNRVNSNGKEPVLINDGTEARSYISEKRPGVFTLEAYLYNHDMRIYSEGSLESSLSLSTWTREAMFEVVCKKIE